MKKYLWILVLLSSLLFLFLLSPQISTAQIKGGKISKPEWLKAWKKAEIPKDYKSPGDLHKFYIRRDNTIQQQLIGKIEPKQSFDYNSNQLIVVNKKQLEGFSRSEHEQLNIRDDMNLIILRDRIIDTTVPEPSVPQNLRFVPTEGKQLKLVQFVGPTKEEWLDDLKAIGNTKIVTYFRNNAHLIQIDAKQLDQLNGLRRENNYIQWIGSFHPAYKIHPSLDTEFDGDVTASIQLVDHKGIDLSISLIKSKSSEVLRDTYRFGPYANIRVKLPASELIEIAKLHDVINVEPWTAPVLYGERQGQILANQLNNQGSQPNGPGYLAWLTALGFTANFDFAVDITDSGLDQGQITPANLHQDFLDVAGNSRVVYVQEVSGTNISTTAANNVDANGHGTLDCAIVGGFNDTQNNNNFEDGAGYQYGLGIAPYVLIGSSRIFNPGFTNPSATELINSAYKQGARISSNSWGARSPQSIYDVISQEYDFLVRDARPSKALDGGQPGNQQMVIVFAAGNSGPNANTIGDRGATAKNTITVGASENWDTTNNADGCNAVTNPPCCDSDDVNDVRDMAFFSSAGPTQDGRTKPDLVAPGTHIMGAASQNPNFDGSGVCGGPDNDFVAPPNNAALGWDAYFPAGQTLYTWSSGTSHATPAVSGACALLRQWFLMQGRLAPSPAMTKAYLMNSSIYMTGANANDVLPSNVQGMGRLGLQRAFDDIPRMLLDQGKLFTQTGDEFSTSGVSVNPNEPFRVTLAWTDAPGNATSVQMNDLDLEVRINGGTTTFLGNTFTNNISQSPGTRDAFNNVESVFLQPGTVTDFEVIVRAQSINADGVPNNPIALDQDFALVIYNGAKKFTASNSKWPWISFVEPAGAVKGQTLNIDIYGGGFTAFSNLTFWRAHDFSQIFGPGIHLTNYRQAGVNVNSLIFINENHLRANVTITNRAVRNGTHTHIFPPFGGPPLFRLHFARNGFRVENPDFRSDNKFFPIKSQLLQPIDITSIQTKKGKKTNYELHIRGTGFEKGIQIALSSKDPTQSEDVVASSLKPVIKVNAIKVQNGNYMTVDITAEKMQTEPIFLIAIKPDGSAKVKEFSLRPITASK